MIAGILLVFILNTEWIFDKKKIFLRVSRIVYFTLWKLGEAQDLIV